MLRLGVVPWKNAVCHIHLLYLDVPFDSVIFFFFQIPKLLVHRMFPNARFSLWIDGKLELVVDPYQILERYYYHDK